MELKRYWEILWRRKWILIFSIFFIPLFTLLLIYAAVPIYKCEAKLKVKINPIESGFFKTMPRDIGKFDFFDKDLVMGSLEEFIKSSPVIRGVIEEMNLRDRKGRFFDPKKFVNPNVVDLLFS